MSPDEPKQEIDPTPEPKSKTPGRACRISGKRKWLPCIPCHVFSIAFFVLVLVVLWFALRG